MSPLRRRRWRLLGAVILAGLLLPVIAILVLLLTNPSPRSVPGWTKLAPLPSARGEVASAVRSLPGRGAGELYVVGGLRSIASTSDRAEVYRAAANRWDELPRLPEARHHAAAALRDRDLHLTGGGEGIPGSPEASHWVLREGADRWEVLDPMPEARLGHRMVSIGGLLLVVGGEGPSARVLAFTPGQGWSRRAELPVQRDHLAVVVRGGEVWAIGGRGEGGPLDDVHIYDLEADEWRAGPELPVPVSAAVEGVIGGDIHLVGGEDPSLIGGGTIDRHLVLRRGAERWAELDRPPLAVHGAGGGALDGRLLLAGGAARQGALSVLAWSDHVAGFDPDAR